MYRCIGTGVLVYRFIGGIGGIGVQVYRCKGVYMHRCRGV